MWLSNYEVDSSIVVCMVREGFTCQYIAKHLQRYGRGLGWTTETVQTLWQQLEQSQSHYNSRGEITGNRFTAESSTKDVFSGDCGQKFGFLQLAGELRNRIYEFTVTANGFVEFRRNKWAPQPGITRVCRQLRKESLPIYYSTKSFVHFVDKSNIEGIYRWLRRIGRDYLKTITVLHIRCDDLYHINNQPSFYTWKVLAGALLDSGLDLDHIRWYGLSRGHVERETFNNVLVPEALAVAGFDISRHCDVSLARKTLQTRQTVRIDREIKALKDHEVKRKRFFTLRRMFGPDQEHMAWVWADDWAKLREEGERLCTLSFDPEKEEQPYVARTVTGAKRWSSEQTIRRKHPQSTGDGGGENERRAESTMWLMRDTGTVFEADC